MTEQSVPDVYVVRADFGRYANDFRENSYVGIGWLPELDLSTVADKEELRQAMQAAHSDANTMSVAQNTGQVWRFLNDLIPGTIVVTPTEDTEKLIVGRVNGDYYYEANPTGSHYAHRKAVDWSPEFLLRSGLSVPLQNSLRSSLTIFSPQSVEQIYQHLGLNVQGMKKQVELTAAEVKGQIIERIRELRPEEFEVLVQKLLVAIGFDAQHVGRSGDGGIDVTGELQVYNFATVNLKVQVKNYKASHYIDHKAIQQFRISVPDTFQAAFVTTSDFNKKAREEAAKPGFKRIGLVNGSQFADILIEHYADLSDEPGEELGISVEAIKDKLRLRHTLIPE